MFGYGYSQTGLEIAVIGMAGRFPGAKNIAEFWDNLKNGVECISFFSEEELEEVGIEPGLLRNPNYIKARAVLQDSEYFDSSFFGYIPLEAELMDPQVRIFHECAWEALEDAGYVAGTSKGRIGVYAGAAVHLGWQVLSLLSGKAGVLGNFAAWQLYDKDFMATRISYKLDLSGPAVNVHTACSTSLVAIHLACQGLLSGECRLALAGGVTAAIPVKQGYLYEEGMIVSRDGHCRAFDAKASGTVFGEGAGIVVLKSLEKAIVDGDYVHAVIKSSAINNDGRDKVGYQAPGIGGQARVIRAALRLARVEPESIRYVETHGTGTNLGDPTEIDALKKAFNTDKKGFCRIGAVKSNVGHLDIAAGIAGFIKTVLMLKHKQVPPSLYFETANPKIDFENSPFIVNTELIEWQGNGYPLRAGVSSFGVGGTNAHVILEESPPPAPSSESREYQLLLLSAKTETALDKMTENLLEWLKNNPGMKLADAAYTLQAGRQAFTHRRMWVWENCDEAAAASAGTDSPSFHTGRVKDDGDNRPVIFMFSGQGSQYVNMGLDLYRTEPLFREEMDRCFEILNPLMGYDIKEILYRSEKSDKSDKSDMSDSSDRSDINQTEIAQPVLFIIEYALARLLMQWGIKPYAMIGHSIGEYTAACLAGAFSLEHALEMVALRGRLMQKMPPGDMLSVSLPEEDLIPFLEENENVSLAAVNTPAFCVVSGSHDAIDRFSKKLEETGHETRLLHTSHAFHSAMMEPILKEFAGKIAKVVFNKPRIPYISNLTGKWITVEDAANPAYWARHIRQTVQFSRGLEELLKNGEAVFLEVGPGKALATFARQHPGKKESHTVIDLLRHPKQNEPDHRFLLDKIGQLWLCGVKIDWEGFHADEKRNRIPLPTYPFERLHYPTAGNPFTMGVRMLSGKPRLEKQKEIANWFYVPLWEQSVPAVPRGNGIESLQPCCWLVFSDGHGSGGLGTRLSERLDRQGHHVIRVSMGSTFRKVDEREFIIDPGQENDYTRLFEELKRLEKIPAMILHLWNVTAAGGGGGSGGNDGDRKPAFERLESILDAGYYSLLNIARSIGKLGITGEIRVGVVTDGMQEVWGGEMLRPEKALVLGPVKTIPREYPNLRCCSMDIEIPGPGSPLEDKLLDNLLMEFAADFSDRVLAYRGAYRWVQVTKPVPFDSPGDPVPRLKEKGVYLITGGLGGIGLTLAGYLAEQVHARLVLTGRSRFPAGKDWEEWLLTHEPTNPISRKIQKLLEIERHGGEVLVLEANGADEERMQKAVGSAIERFGPIDGVIHAAGLPDGGLIQIRTREMSENVFESKVRGTLVLEHIFKDKPLDIFVLCSSLSSVIGPPGQVAYNAANAFLDAYALHKTRMNSGELTLSIGWDAWQEVGMAAEAVRKLTAAASGEIPAARLPLPSPPLSSSSSSAPSREVVPAAYPLFDYRIETDSNETVYVTHFRVDRHWVLDEHRILGKPTLPGTACVEMVRAAFEDYTGNENIEILAIYFLTPFRIEEEREKELHTVLEKAGNHYRFVIRSPVNSAAGEDRWVEHARGEIAAAEPRPIKKYDINELLERCNEETIIVTREMLEADRSQDRLNFVFGPRWKNVREVHLGSHQALLVLELAAEFSGDIGVYKLHPALLDTAAGYFRKAKGDNGDNEGSLPFSYRGVRVRGALPRRLYSYQEYEAGNRGGKKLVKYSITLMDEHGVELVDIEEYKRLTVSEAAKERLEEEETAPGVKEQIIGHGILPAEGIEVFSRILGRGLPWVLVSTRDFASVLEVNRGSKEGGADMPDELEQEKPSGPLRPRPEITKPYVPPGSEIEIAIAQIWQDFLGIEKIGVHDDFFELGGDSLKVMTIIAKIRKKLDVEISIGEFFNKPTIQGISGSIAGIKKSLYTEIEFLEKKEYYPLSSAQKRIHTLCQIDPTSTVYNLPVFFEMEGRGFDREKVAEIFRTLIKRHESLQTWFEEINGEFAQRTTDELELELEFYDIQDIKQEGQNAEGKDKVIDHFIRPFDLSKVPLVRVGLMKLAETRHVLMLDMHHIVSDGLSLLILYRDFLALYEGLQLPVLTTTYKDYAQWQSRKKAQKLLKQQEAYWLKQFESDIPVLNLPTDYPRSSEIKNFEGSQLYFNLSEEKTRVLRKLALEEGVTLYMLLLAIFYVVLFKLSGQEDIIVGSPLAGRNHSDLQHIIGMFVNTLALRNFPAENKTFSQFLKEIKERTLEAFENQDYQFEELVEKIKVRRDMSRNPLFDVMFELKNMLTQGVDMVETGVTGMKITQYEYKRNTSAFDLMMSISELEHHLDFRLDYSTKLFKKERIERFWGLFKEILDCVSDNREIILKDIKISHYLGVASVSMPETGFEF